MTLGTIHDGAQIRWGELNLTFKRLGPGSWRVEGDLELDVFWELDGLPLVAEPAFCDEGLLYFIDLVPDVVVPPRSTKRLEIPIPVKLRLSAGGAELGEFFPPVKKAYLGSPTEGRFAVYVVPQRVKPPLAHLWADVVNEADERLLLDELTVNPKSLSLFKKEGAWVTDLVKVFPGEDSLEVKPTGLGEGERLIEGRAEPEVFTRFKKIARRLRGVVA